MKRSLLMVWLLVVAGLASAQAPPPRHPSGRITNLTPTPTSTPDPCAGCPAIDSPWCAMAWNACVQCWADCGQPIVTPTPTHPTTPTRTPTPQIPTGVDERCQYVSTPWGGSRCEITAEICSLLSVPMFLSERGRVRYKLDTSATKDVTEMVVDFRLLDETSIKLSHEWDESSLTWVEWYVKTGDAYSAIPTLGCYCNDRESRIYICMDGQVMEADDE